MLTKILRKLTRLNRWDYITYTNNGKLVSNTKCTWIVQPRIMMGWIYGTYGTETYTRFWWEDQLEDLNADGRTILKQILKRMKGCGLDSSGSGQ